MSVKSHDLYRYLPVFGAIFGGDNDGDAPPPPLFGKADAKIGGNIATVLGKLTKFDASVRFAGSFMTTRGV